MDHFDNKLQQKFRDFTQAPPDSAWEAIELQLKNNSAKRNAVWYKVAATVALLIAATFTAFWITTVDVSNTMIVEEVNHEPSITTETSNEKPDPTGLTDLNEKFVLSNNPNLILAENNTEKEKNSLSEPKAPNEVHRWYGSQSVNTLHGFGTQTALVALDTPASGLLAEKSQSDIISVDLSGYEPGFISNNSALSAFSLSAYFSPQQSYRYQAKSTFIPYENVESELLSFATGVNIHYKISKRVEFQSGIAYSRMGQRIHDVAIFAHPSMTSLYTNNGQPISRHPQRMNTSLGGILFTDQSFYYADMSTQRILTLKGSYDDQDVKLLNKTGNGLVQQLNYFEIPLNVRYKVFEQGFSVSLKAGISTNILKSNRIVLNNNEHRNTPVGEMVDIYTFSWSGLGGVVLDFPLNNRVSLLIEPTVSMFLTPIDMKNDVSGKTHPYNQSLFIGFSYDLR